MEEFFLKEVHKIYNYADSPAVERRIYWLVKQEEKRNLMVEVEHYVDAHIYKFFIEDEESSDHDLGHMKQIAEISSIKQLNQIEEEEVIRRILNSIEGTSMKDQYLKQKYLKQIDEEVWVWIKSIECLDLSDLKDNLV